MKSPALLWILAALPLAACAADEGTTNRSSAAVSPAARVVGEGLTCIPLNAVRESRVRDDWTIDFIDSGNRAWRNTLTSRCAGLRSANAITYQTSLSQLCNTDIIYTLQQGGGGPQRGNACSLGLFVPVELGH